MARKKRRRLQQKNAQTETEAFNPALRGLKLVQQPPVLQTDPSPLPTKTLAVPREELDDRLVFLRAMSDVKPLTKGPERVEVPVPNGGLRPAHAPRNDDLEVMAHLSDLISGNAEMDIRFTDEYMEGSVKGFDQKLMRRLRNGEFPVQDYVDLHGLTRQEGENRIQDYLLRCYGQGLRCVLVVHGRGLNSEDGVPVLKRDLPRWLSRGPVRRIILAFATARPYDGGTGALYVLLKRYQGVVLGKR